MQAHIDKIKYYSQEAPNLWGFKPCLTEKEIQAYEQKFGTRLPEEYREFLLQVGNGGEKPYHELYPIETPLSYIKQKNWHQLSKPFPFQEEYKITKYAEYEAFTYDEFHLPGCLSICNYGCGIDFLLITAGENKGEIWWNDPGNDERLCVLYSVRTSIKHNYLTFVREYMQYGDVLGEE